jgi:hypothetical protein
LSTELNGKLEECLGAVSGMRDQVRGLSDGVRALQDTVNMIIVQPVTRSWMEERIEMLEAEVVRLRGQNELLIMRVRELGCDNPSVRIAN